MLALPGTNRKRSREDADDAANTQDAHFDKRTRQTTGRPGDDEKWYHGHHDSVLGTPTFGREQPKYDSDEEQSSSIVSEPGSPQDVSMSSGDEIDDSTFSQSPEDNFIPQPRAASRSPWGQRLQTNRVATPTVSMRPSARTCVRQHVRRRHPQENISSDHLEVPSPIDEDEVPTPPSAAEAAGSQLSMLSVSDMDMDENDLVPTISIEPARPATRNTATDTNNRIDAELVDSGPDGITVRKQRQRSGALSSGNSPVRAGPSSASAAKQRGFSVGFRADCEKCRMRVPGHMNHFFG